MQEDERPRAAVVRVGAVIIPAEECEPIWRALRAELLRHHRDDGPVPVRPGIAAVLEALRAAALAHMSVTSAPDGHPADIAASCQRDLITTGELALSLGVSERHARRIAEAEGVAPVFRGWWRAEDARVLREARRR